MTIIRERVAETIGLVLWFGVLDQDNFSRTSTCGREKVLGKDILVYFKMMIKFSQSDLGDINTVQCCGREG